MISCVEFYTLNVSAKLNFNACAVFNGDVPW